MKKLWRKIPKSLAERIAISFLTVALPGVLYFEIFHVFPVVHQTETESKVHMGIVAFIFLQTVTNFYKLVSSDSSHRRVFLPSVIPKENPGWIYCPFCQVNAPPRSTHCHVCSTCVLRRDHHCYFSGSCVGFYNHRYFLLFVVYLVIGCLYCIIQNTEFIVGLADRITMGTIACMFFPIFTLFLDVDSHVTSASLFIYSLCIVAGLMTSGLLAWQLNQILRGQTGREYNENNFKYDSGSYRKNLMQVLGTRWYLTWIAPWVPSPLIGDGTEFSPADGKSS
ncbi:probable palmitoyltransferase ZDHHC24 [Oscarella lobularis]|uniref:probable palmitoyltransferase ZDHHC24 n=1 Tax=Oscarella lobularis TaxID=121494 RepID=UPI0033137144